MPEHRVDAYAASVLAGETVAGPYVRQACERHVRDRARAALQPDWYQFSADRADHALSFIEECLRLPDMLDADGEPQPFRLQPWQVLITGSLFGWIDKTGYRRFREAYVETGKGSGKSPLAAAIGIYGLMMDGERAAEIYAAAANQDQASVLFRHAVQIGQCSPDVRDELAFDGGEHIWQIRHPYSLSFFRTFSRESGQKSGTRPHMGMLDELHEHQSPETTVKIRAGAKRRPQPVFFEITNAGFDRTSVCWQRHEHARKVVEQVVQDEQLLSYICALDEGDDPLTDETCWPKTNPSLPITPSVEYLRRQASNARNIPTEFDTNLRLNWCVWTRQQTRAIDMKQWLDAKAMPTAAELLAAEWFGCFDMGQTDDFTAWARLGLLPDGRVAVKMRYFLPGAALERYPNRPYAQWERSKILTVTDGDVTDYEQVRKAIREDCAACGIKTVFYDQHTAKETAQLLMTHGLDMVPIPQGIALHEAINRLLALVSSKDLCHGNDEILTWMASNVVIRPGDRKRLDKERAPEKIDGISAIVTGIEGALVRRDRAPAPQFQFLVYGGR